MTKKSAPELLVVLGKLTVEHDLLETIIYLLVRKWGWRVGATGSKDIKRIYQKVAECATDFNRICSQDFVKLGLDRVLIRFGLIEGQS